MLKPKHQIIFCKNLFSVPWNQQSIHGWITSSSYTMIVGTGLFFLKSAFLSFYIGISLYFEAFSTIFQSKIMAAYDKDKSNGKGYEEIRRTFCEAIEFHIFIKK